MGEESCGRGAEPVTLGDIDKRCALTGENPVDVLERLLLARDARSEFISADTLGVIA